MLEVGVGTGKNIEYYPEGIDITGTDFSNRMLERAKRKAAFYNIKVELLLMDVLNPLVVNLYGANINRKTVENISKAGYHKEDCYIE